MQKIEITQEELNQGAGQFDPYMEFVWHRISSKSSAEKLALFHAVDVIQRDGLSIQVGSNPDDAGIVVANWFSNFLGTKAKISYCLPAVAYQLHGIPYLLRMPIVQQSRLLLTQAVIDLTPEIAKSLSDKQTTMLQRDFNEFYEALFVISRLDATTVIHLESAAERICESAVHNALSRWESLHFVERAMKEVLDPLGVRTSGSQGHDIAGSLHAHWINAGKQPLPQALLSDVQCSAAIRYERSPIPFVSTLKAHHSSIRLAALIASEIPAVSEMKDTLTLSHKGLARNASLEIARAIPAFKKLIEPIERTELIRD